MWISYGRVSIIDSFWPEHMGLIWCMGLSSIFSLKTAMIWILRLVSPTCLQIVFLFMAPPIHVLIFSVLWAMTSFKGRFMGHNPFWPEINVTRTHMTLYLWMLPKGVTSHIHSSLEGESGGGGGGLISGGCEICLRYEYEKGMETFVVWRGHHFFLKNFKGSSLFFEKF